MIWISIIYIVGFFLTLLSGYRHADTKEDFDKWGAVWFISLFWFIVIPLFGVSLILIKVITPVSGYIHKTLIKITRRK